MQFVTLFSIATSIALASAGIVKNRQDSDDIVATFNLFTSVPAADECTSDNDAAQVVNLGSQVVGGCLGGSSEGWPSIQLTELNSTYWFRVYTTDDCSTDDDTDAIVAPGGCETSNSGKPWLRYQLTSPDE